MLKCAEMTHGEDKCFHHPAKVKFSGGQGDWLLSLFVA